MDPVVLVVMTVVHQNAECLAELFIPHSAGMKLRPQAHVAGVAGRREVERPRRRYQAECPTQRQAM